MTLRVLAFAYACEPGRGSEPAAGWGLTRAVAADVDLTVLVGGSHARGLAAWREAHPQAPGRYVVVPEPAWARRLAPGRFGWFLRYLAWLEVAADHAAALQASEPFDVVWQASYATYWLPTPAGALGPPLLWGPVGGAVTTPRQLWPELGWRGLPGELLDRVAVRGCARWPSTRRSWRQATTVVVQNRETLAALPPDLRRRATVLNHAVFAETAAPPAGTPRDGPVLHLSPLESRKGPGLVLRALATTPPDVRVTFVGDGPLRTALERRARRLGVAERVSFLGRVPHSEVARLLATASCAVFTGLREEGGIALAEALGAGTPTVALAHGGVRTIAASVLDPERITLVEPGPVDLTARRLGAAMTRALRQPSSTDGPLLDVAAARAQLLALLRRTALAPAPDT